MHCGSWPALPSSTVTTPPKKTHINNSHFFIDPMGLSAMSWAVCVKEMVSRTGPCRFLAMDARGHGDTVVEDGDYGALMLIFGYSRVSL